MIKVTIGKNNFTLSLVSSKPLGSPIFWTLVAIEVLTICFSLAFLPTLIRVFNKTSLFHKNLIRITQALLICFYPNIMSRMVLFLYDVQVLSPEEKPYHGILLVTACFVRLWCLNIMILYLPAVIVERIFASKYINNYERYPRPWIHRIIVPLVVIISAIAALNDVLGRINSFIIPTAAALLFVAYCVAYITLFRRDSRRMRALDKGLYHKDTAYTLSTKFQLKENLRMMKVLTQLSLMWATSVVISCCSFTLAKMVLAHSLYWNQMSHQIIDDSVAISFVIITSVFAVNLGVAANIGSFFRKKSSIAPGIESRALSDHRGTSDAYFTQLTRSWKVSTKPALSA
ncbi:hypothetical protein V3C99_013614 [Haemonchus contortus]